MTTTTLPTRPLGHERPRDHHRRLRRLGRRRRRLGLRLGPAGRRGLDRRHAPRARAGRQLDRHRRGLRAGPLRGGRGPAAPRAARRRAAARLHQVRPGVERARPDGARPCRPSSPASIRAEVEASLRRLGVERIDLYQFHWPDAVGHAGRGLVGEMARLVDEGKVRAAGVSNFDVALLERCEPIRHVDSLQPPFSLIRREAGGRRDPLVRGARHRRDRLQPDAVGPPDRSASTAHRVAAWPRDDWRAPLGRLPAAAARSATSRCATRSARSRGGTAPRSPRSRWPGRSPGPA